MYRNIKIKFGLLGVVWANPNYFLKNRSLFVQFFTVRPLSDHFLTVKT